eukprot:c11631_g1_i1.p1 GENE.c11631_g1_i1~~c11631_g1_i1.p1  ORF type:complete len:366 (+),score=27.44 c11631_g1_i1:121-1218(+)
MPNETCDTLWIRGSCPVRMLCVPTSTNEKVCDCRFSTDMLQNDGDGCSVTALTYFFAAFWIIITIIAIIVASSALMSLRKFRLAKHLTLGNSLGVAAISTEMGAWMLVVVGICRVSYLFVFDSNAYLIVDWAFVICQGLFGFFLALSLVSFGLSLLLILVKNSSLSRSYNRTKTSLFRASFILGVILVAGVGPLSYMGLNAINGMFVAFWALFVWLIFYKVYFRLKLHLNNSTVHGMLTSNIFGSLTTVLVRLMVGSAGFFLSNVMYVVFFYGGHEARSSVLLAQLSAAAVVIQFTSLTMVTVVMIRSQVMLLEQRAYPDRADRIFSSQSIKSASNALIVYPTGFVNSKTISSPATIPESPLVET